MKTKLLLLTAFTVFSAKAQFGAIDATFATNGFTLTDVVADNLENSNSCVVRSNGKILLSGDSEILGEERKLTLVQYNPDGTLDQSFATGGILRFTAPDFYAVDYQQSSVILPDGKILTAGSAAGNSTNNYKNVASIVRFNENGTLDTTFGTNGIFTFGNLTRHINITSIALQNDGKIIIGGRLWLPQSTATAVLIRANADGTLDPDFGTNGSTEITADPHTYLRSIALQSDGKIVSCGYIYSDNQQPTQIIVTRCNANGTLDISFGTNGAIIANPGINSRAEKVLVQSDAKILVTGMLNLNIPNGSFAALRYNPNGTIDSTYGTNGLSFQDGYNDVATTAILQPDGKLIIGGLSGNRPVSPSEFMLKRYNTDGSVDTTFGNAGILLSDFNNNGNNVCQALAMQGDKLIAGGWSNDEQYAVARYTLTENLGINPNAMLTLQVYPNPATDFIAVGGNALIGKKYQILDLNGKITATGTISVNRIPVSQLQKGLYLFKVEDGRAEKILVR